MCRDENNNKEEREMGVTENNSKLTKKYTKKIPHLKVFNGKVVINEKEPEQVRWFEEFKK